MKKTFNSHNIAVYGIYLSIMLLMTFIPDVGYIRAGSIELTTMCIPVTIICLHLGWRGAIFAFIAFPITSFLRGIAYGSGIIANFGIWEGGVVTLICSRLLCGIVITGLTFILNKYFKKMFIKAVILGAAIPLLNTVIVLSFLSVFSPHGFAYWMTIVLVQAMIELGITVGAACIFSFSLSGFVQHHAANFKKRWDQ